MDRIFPRPGALVALAFIWAIAALPCLADELYSDKGFFIDVPEGFGIVGGNGKDRFILSDETGTVQLAISAYEPSRYPSAKAMAKDILVKFKSEGDSEAFSYRGRASIFAELAFNLSGERDRGWALFIEGAPATGGAAAEPDYAVLAFVEESAYDSFLDLMLSALDGFSIDGPSRLEPGPVSAFLYREPATPPPTRRLRFLDESFELPYDPAEGEAVQDLVEREFRVLAGYLEHPLWKEAWARFYKMVYRASSSRLAGLAMMVSRSAERLVLEGGEEPGPRLVAGKVLAWVQGFAYERDPSGSDFVNPVTAAFEGRGDCDTRALLMAIILHRMNIDAILMVSRELAHALAAVDAPGTGARFPFETPEGSKEYLVAETTAKVDIGLVAKEQADPGLWLGIGFGF